MEHAADLLFASNETPWTLRIDESGCETALVASYGGTASPSLMVEVAPVRVETDGWMRRVTPEDARVTLRAANVPAAAVVTALTELEGLLVGESFLLIERGRRGADTVCGARTRRRLSKR